MGFARLNCVAFSIWISVAATFYAWLLSAVAVCDFDISCVGVSSPSVCFCCFCEWCFLLCSWCGWNGDWVDLSCGIDGWFWSGAISMESDLVLSWIVVKKLNAREPKVNICRSIDPLWCTGSILGCRNSNSWEYGYGTCTKSSQKPFWHSDNDWIIGSTRSGWVCWSRPPSTYSSVMTNSTNGDGWEDRLGDDGRNWYGSWICPKFMAKAKRRLEAEKRPRK